MEKAPYGASFYVEKIGLTSTSFGINFSPDIVIMEKAPYGASFYVEKIGLEPTTS
jgi:hypothetical protein